MLLLTTHSLTWHSSSHTKASPEPHQVLQGMVISTWSSGWPLMQATLISTERTSEKLKAYPRSAPRPDQNRPLLTPGHSWPCLHPSRKETSLALKAGDVPSYFYLPVRFAFHPLVWAGLSRAKNPFLFLPWDKPSNVCRYHSSPTTTSLLEGNSPNSLDSFPDTTVVISSSA